MTAVRIADAQQAEAAKLEAAIAVNLAHMGYRLDEEGQP